MPATHRRRVREVPSARGMDATRGRLQRVLAMYVVALGLLACGAWTTEYWVERHTTHFDVPLIAGHWLHTHVGSRFMQRYQGTFPESSEPRGLFAPLHVDIAYRSQVSRFGRSLLAVALPTWPLPVAATCAGLLLVLPLPSRRLVHRDAAPPSSDGTPARGA